MSKLLVSAMLAFITSSIRSEVSWCRPRVTKMLKSSMHSIFFEEHFFYISNFQIAGAASGETGKGGREERKKEEFDKICLTLGIQGFSGFICS